ncbi:hypothetical protein ABPG77_011393 [Micractinium sp. CCAP 211/92]
MAPPEVLFAPSGADSAAVLGAPSSLRTACVAVPGAAAHAAPSTPLLQLFAEVDAAFEAERARGHTIGAHQAPESTERLDAAVRTAFQRYLAQGHADWRQLARFCDEHYVRHLVEESANCEMILICWKKGQASRIHNHAQSHCWLNVLSGGVEELRFTTGDSPVEAGPTLAPRLPGVIAATSPCPLLVSAGINKVAPGQSAYINDSLGLHAVRCDDDACGVPGAEEGAVSLHIYAPPIRRVRLYEPEADRVVVRAPGFRTIRGVEEEEMEDASLLSSSL